MIVQDTRKGVMMMVATTVIFALQDGISRHLAGTYNVYLVVMVRYWFFALFVLALAARAPGGVRAAARTAHPWLQAMRGLLLVGIGVKIFVYAIFWTGMRIFAPVLAIIMFAWF